MVRGISKQLEIANCFSPSSDVSLLKGDATETLKKIPDNSINLIITSPPYNLNKDYEEREAFSDYLKKINPIIKELDRVLCDNGSICWQVGNYVNKGEIFPLDIFFYNSFKELGYKLRNRIIWHFNSGLHATKRFSGRYETMMWFTKSDDYIFNLDSIRIPQKYQGKTHHKGKKYGQLSGNPKGKNPSDFWELLKSEFDIGVLDFPNVKANHPEKDSHPCQFPIEFVERCVLAFSNEGHLVLDPFSGVGSTILGSVMNNRRAIGCEIIDEYIKKTRERLLLLQKGELPYREKGKPIGRATGKVAKKVFENS